MHEETTNKKELKMSDSKLKLRILLVTGFMMLVMVSSGCRTSGVGLNASVSGGGATSAQTTLLPLPGQGLAADKATTGTDTPDEHGNEPERLTVLEAFSLSDNTALSEMAPSGHARYSGRMQGYQFNQPSGANPFVEGRASLDFGLSTNLLDVKFSEVASRDGKRALADFGFEDLAVTENKTFARSDESGSLYGAFFGPADEEAAGSFRYNETDIFGSFSARYIPDVLPSLREAAKAIPRLGDRSVTQSTNTNISNITTDNAEAVFDRGQMALTVTRSDGRSFSLESGTTHPGVPGIPIRSDQTAREWQLEKKFDDGTVRVRSFGEAPENEFPLRAIHTGMQSGVNWVAVHDWKRAKAAGRSDPLVPLETIEHFKSVNVNWVGLSVSLMFESTTDSTVKPIHTHDKYPNATTTYTDDEIRQIVREFKSHGFNVYMTLTLGDEEVLGHPVPPVGSPEVPSHLNILPKDWPWSPNHPDHKRFVAEFLGSYADQAVHYAKLAEEEGVGMYSLGTEEPGLFRTRPGGGGDKPWTNHFRNELQSMVARVREVYSGKLTYDRWFPTLTNSEYFIGGKAGTDPLWKDLGLDVIGISAWFPLTETNPSTVTSLKNLETSYEKIFQQYLVPLKENNPGKPIMFLEYAAAEAVESPAFPDNDEAHYGGPRVFVDADGNGLDDGKETQANMYQALLNTMEKYPGVLNGVFWWDNWIATDALWADFLADYRAYSIRGKLSEDVIRSAYETWADWLTGGYWMHVADNMDLIDAGAFVDGPELNGTPTLPYLGTATYKGFATGGFASEYGSDHPNVSAGAHEVGEYEGELQLTADFTRRRISGQIQKIHVSGIRTPLVGTSRPFANVPVPYEFNLGETRFSSRGFTGKTTVTSTDPGIRIAGSDGSWGGKFSIVPDGDGNPRVVAGTHGEEFTTTGGTRAGFIGAFAGATSQ